MWRRNDTKKLHHTYKYYLHPFRGRKHVVATTADSGAFAPEYEIIVSRVQFKESVADYQGNTEIGVNSNQTH